jgi:hypothetical protein
MEAIYVIKNQREGDYNDQERKHCLNLMCK